LLKQQEEVAQGRENSRKRELKEERTQGRELKKERTQESSNSCSD